ncbi:MAG: 3-deoxy-D-manno-octulosonic acid kinase, partial [Venatoribacter sp.]
MKSQQRTNNSRIWYDSSLIETPSDSLFDPAYWQSQGLVLGSAKGRGTTWFVQTPKINAALRHFYRGGLLGKLIKDSYLFVTWGLTRSAQEFSLLHELRQCGVNVPRPVAARAIKKGFFYQADILTELVDGAQDLLAVLSNRSLTTAE